MFNMLDISDYTVVHGFLGALLGLGGSLISGLLGQSSAKKRQGEDHAAIERANAIATENANKMNTEVRARADKAAKVLIVTKSKHTTNQKVVTTKAPDVSTSTQWRGPDTTTTTGNVKAMVDAAEANGFNPLTLLRAGGLGSFSSSRTTYGNVNDKTVTKYGKSVVQESGGTTDESVVTGSTAMDAALAGQHIPQLSAVISQERVPGIGDVIGNALNTGINAFLTDKQQAQQNQFQMDMLQATLNGANQPGASTGSRSFATPSARIAGGNISTVSGPAFGASAPGPYSGGGTSGTTFAGGGGSGWPHYSGTPATTFKNPGDTLKFRGNDWPTDAYSSNAEDCETRYGDSEIVGMICGAGVAAADLWANRQAIVRANPVVRLAPQMNSAANSMMNWVVGNMDKVMFVPSGPAAPSRSSLDVAGEEYRKRLYQRLQLR